MASTRTKVSVFAVKRGISKTPPRKGRRLPPLRVFLSYNHKDKTLAGRLKAMLEEYGFVVFVAHDDISPSVEWQDCILRELKGCHVFLPLLTNRFHRSKWTDQETGLAIAHGKVLVPLRVQVNPYGFAARYQALAIRPRQIKRSTLDLLRTILAHNKLRSKAINSLVNSFGSSPDYGSSRDRSGLLLEAQRVSKAQINQVLRFAANNDQLYGSWPTNKNLNKLIRKFKRQIEPHVLTEYKKARVTTA